ncbi:hypothetical protein [Thiohalophilus thiocyanatoxydans]|uniref:Uncharacterized protein n=1 Tax=Thiohalophilus thiocyanatoxydans TaxID=381308 RepID=A0A4R8IHD4_9GAMM|nr:hypothetical protein [Thiohalophilus thiocyanatoxydans]TDY00012.1 hypothetical protein EDC23_2173 [Thiohalophilus thiocyanatoxydans]
MNQLLLQIIFRQWDKGERSEADVQRRAALPDRYPLERSSAQTLGSDNIVIDCHGDDRLGNRLQYRRLADHTLQIDRFHIDDRYLAYTDDTTWQTLDSLREPWIQARYQWRYRVEESGLIYWLYEEVILNVARAEQFQAAIFISSEPAAVHASLAAPTSGKPPCLAG